MKVGIKAVTSAAALCVGMWASAQAGVVRDAIDSAAQVSPAMRLVPSGKGWGVVPAGGQEAAKAPAPARGNGINYSGGPVMIAATGVKVYVIWYGDWARGC